MLQDRVANPIQRRLGLSGLHFRIIGLIGMLSPEHNLFRPLAVRCQYKLLKPREIFSELGATLISLRLDCFLRERDNLREKSVISIGLIQSASIPSSPRVKEHAQNTEYYHSKSLLVRCWFHL
jgi:hypothetical protein